MTPESQLLGPLEDKSSRWVWLEQWGKDAAFAVRSLSRARGFTLTVLATLGLGIGVATIAFNLTAWILFREQPYPHSERLFMVGYKDKQSPFTPIRSGLHLQAYQEQTKVFSEIAAVKRDLANVVVADEPGIANVLSVSVDCLRVLGLKPVLGRGFLPGEHRAGPDNVVVISDLFWREKFQTAADVLGRKILVDQQVCTVIGVFRAGQPFPAGFDGEIYRPLVLIPDATKPFDQMLMVIGRLAPGVSPEQATAALATVKLTGLPSWAEAFFAGQQPVLNKLTYLFRPETFWVIFAAAALLYAIACLNAMNLMLVRLLGRRRELSIRLALGGTRWQLMRLLVIESVGLAITASLAVVLAARWLFPPLFELINGNAAARYQDFWNLFNLGCIGGLGLLACVTVVVVPAWRLSKADINANLKEGGTAQGTSRRMARLRSGLVILQAAFAVILLAGTGLMFRSFAKLRQVDLGFKPNGIVKVRVAFPRGYDLAPEARLQLFERLQERLATVPGVRAVSYGQDTLLEGGFWGTAQLLMPDGTYRPVAGSFVAENFLKTAGLTLKKGRWLSGRRGEFEVVVNEAFAKARFGDEDPIGKTFRLLVSGDYGNPIVGVVADVKETVRSVAGMRMYVPNWAYPPNISSLLLRLDQDPPKEFAGVVRRAIYEADPRLIVSTVNSINVEVNNSMWSERYAFMILKGLAVIALGLAVVGLFSVIAFTVDSRRQEFGVRLALGATPANLHGLVMRRGVTTAAVGIVIGVAGALGLTRFMQSLLFETTPNDPVVYAAVAVLMLGAAALACWLPARRAAKADPIVALRAE
jgi:putative ABC transport system permease protein